MSSKNIAVILAGGVGSRSGLGTPKQFFKVAGKTVIEHTVNVFDNHHLIDEIAIVTNPLYNREIEDMVLRNKWKKVKKILAGGKERYESSLAAINAYADDPECNLIFHDARSKYEFSTTNRFCCMHCITGSLYICKLYAFICPIRTCCSPPCKMIEYFRSIFADQIRQMVIALHIT